MVEKHKFIELLAVVDQLLSPNGCPWDQNQTVESLTPQLLDEVYEFIDAFLQNDHENMKEEFGDMFFTLLLVGRKAESENRFSLIQALEEAKEKLIRRHPHIFEKKEKLTEKEVLNQWHLIKQKEKSQKPKKEEQFFSSLMKAQKKVRKLKEKTEKPFWVDTPKTPGEKLFSWLWQNDDMTTDWEMELRKTLIEKTPSN